MTTDWKALCAELMAAIEKHVPSTGDYGTVYVPEQVELDELIDRARAALAQPEPEGPSDEELWELYQGPGTFSPIEFARAVLARWGCPTPQPRDCNALP